MPGNFMTTPPPDSTEPATSRKAAPGAPAVAPARAPADQTLGTILLDRRPQEADKPLLLLAGDLEVPPTLAEALSGLLADLQSGAAEPLVLTVLSNAVPALNPWAGLGPGEGEDAAPRPGPTVTGNLVALLGPGELHEWAEWPAHAALLSPAALDVLARPGTTAGNAAQRLRRAGGRILLADTLFLDDPRRDLFAQRRLEPHEQRRAPAWGALTERLDDWLRRAGPPDELAPLLDRFRSARRPPTLHVTHSWGGGVARWVESFVEADTEGVQFQLRAEGPETGEGCGQRLALYLDNRLDAPVAQWWLQPPIRSCTAAHAGYRKILSRVLDRYGIGRVVISSLVGHSLDALSTGLPTIQVLHDFFPAWPLLGVHPEPYLQEDHATDLPRAMQEHELLEAFRDRDAEAWRALGERWRERVREQGTRLVAPSRSVVELLHRLDTGWSAADIAVVPHGLPPLPGTAEVRPRERADGRLRIVVPGRIQEGKGQRLLLEALPELTRYARIVLLGSGKSGEAFFGRSGVDVVIQYDRDRLRELLAGFGPHLACLLSVVPETFSYTLSEMQQLGVPVVATRVGSLAERIEDGRTGWLIEPDAAALIERVRALAADPVEIHRVRAHLPAISPPQASDMLRRYDALCPAQARPAGLPRMADLASDRAAALAYHNQALARRVRGLEAERVELRDELDRRAAWAESLERARQEEVERRVRWVKALEEQLEERAGELQRARDELDRTRANYETMLNRLQAQHDWVLASRSWRLTRPFRVVGRVFANLNQARAWNPLRWPLLLSQVSRTVRTRGLQGALVRAQLQQAQFVPVTVGTDRLEAIGDPGAPERLPRAEQPDVSIVIPVHNQWLHTAACLRSLVDADCDASFEVIVVDDESSDESAGHLEKIENLVYLRNEENLGFVRSCNRGAAEARGRYVLMLNNDTQVLDGWLDALLATFEQHPDTGLAGARLVYPDGRLQEAGGIVFNDGSGWNYGKGDNAARPEYQFSREADYCSGACIVLRRDLFEALGGFDTHFAPAYYEDTDLAFRVRARGLRVRVQPAATVVHHEGATSGTDLSSGAKRYQAVNREKFLQRWRDELQACPRPIADPRDRGAIRRARDHRLAGRVLIVDAYTPEPDQDSGSLRLRYLMDCFQQLGYGVTFLPDNRAHAGRYTRELQSRGVEAVYDPWLHSLQRFFEERGEEFDFVMVSRHYVASRYVSLIRRHCPRARFLFDTVDLHYLREERLAELEDSLPLKRAAAQTRRSELGVIGAADATLVVSPVEKTVLREAAPGARVHVVSNVHEVVGSRRPFAERKDIFFVGGYQHPPNIDAAQWFVGSIWPLIRKELPDVVFHLIGSKAPEAVRALDGDGVVFQGFVEELEPWLDGCRVAVAPLRYGAGIKGKVNISMSRGQPVVATPAAVEGMCAEPGRDVLVAETAEDFAGAVVRLYRDEALWNRISAGGLDNVQKFFSVDTARRALQDLLKALE